MTSTNDRDVEAGLSKLEEGEVAASSQESELLAGNGSMQSSMKPKGLGIISLDDIPAPEGYLEVEHEIPRIQSKDSDETDDELVRRMPSNRFAEMAKEFEERIAQVKRMPSKTKVPPPSSGSTNRNLLVDDVLGDGDTRKGGGHHKKKGAFAGVFVPTCENMWGVLIFLRFYFIVGNAGVAQALCVVVLSFSAAFCTTSSMSAIASSGGLVSGGGPYFMISRAMGPSVGAAVGFMYWLAITMLAVLEVLGAVEGILMAAPGAEFSGCKQAYGSVLMLLLVLFVWGGINFVTKLGLFFVFVVFYTLLSYYFGICAAPLTDEANANPWVTGLSFETLQDNWSSHYGEGVSFGVVLSVFFPCFTGILSGANRADVLRDPPKNIRQGTFGAIFFSLFMYSSFMILWGMAANYQYLRGDIWHDDHGRRLAGGAQGAHIVEEVVFNPFPHSAHAGIIISSLSQALQCLIVAPRLLQSIAKDRILKFFNPLAPLSKSGEPVRALWASYLVAGGMVLIGELNMVAPLLSMCFLVAYSFMNISCFMLTMLKSATFRPQGIQKRRWRIYYMTTGGFGFLICLSIMFTIDHFWALAALAMSVSLYAYINWTLEAREWGSALDGIRFQLALRSLIKMEETQQQAVNWRPQVLILYRILLAQELKGIKHHEILRLYSQLRKANGFCVVACVLEADQKDEHALHKAKIEKGIIKSIMKEEGIQGFAEVVVAPSWSEGTGYIIQLTGVGGMVPNTVMLEWPENWKKKGGQKARDFVSVLRTALAAEKAVIAMKGVMELPDETVSGTIDIWWMIHDGGFMILLSWLLVHHRVWRKCQLRVFTITEGVSEEKANAAAELLTRTLRQRRLFEVDVEVILADHEMLHPYTHDWTMKLEERKKFLDQLGKSAPHAAPGLEIDDLFRDGSDELMKKKASLVNDGNSTDDKEGTRQGRVSVSDARLTAVEKAALKAPKRMTADERKAEEGKPVGEDEIPTKQYSTSSRNVLMGLVHGPAGDESKDLGQETRDMEQAAQALNEIIYARSKRAQLVVMNLPDAGHGDVNGSKEQMQQSLNFMSYCDSLTRGLERVMYVHSTGHEVFDISDH